MIVLGRKQLSFLVPIALLVSLLVLACTAESVPISAPITEAELTAQAIEALPWPAETDPPSRTYELALNPLKTDLNLGEQVVLLAAPLGAEQTVPNLQWALEPASGYGETYGSLSSDSGPSVIYTAPDVFPVSVIVTAKRADTEESNQIQFNIIGPPPSATSLLLQGGGGPLEDQKAQDVLLAALPFKDLLAAAFPDQNATLAVELSNRPRESDATNLSYNYDWAKSEAGYYFGDNAVPILVPAEAEQLTYLANLMVKDHLEQVGIKAYVEVVPAADIITKMGIEAASGLPVMALTTQ